MLVWIGVFILSSLILWAGSRRATVAGGRLARLLGFSSAAAAIVVMALGSALPELLVSVSAVMRGNSELVASLAVGSMVFNATVVVAVASFASRRFILASHRSTVLIAVATIAFAAVVRDGFVVLVEAIFLLALGVASLILLATEYRARLTAQATRRSPFIIEFGILFLAFIVTNVAAGVAVESIIGIADLEQWDPSTLAALALAAAVSLPELAVALIAARRGAYAIALGAVLGANILNATLVVALPALIEPLAVPSVVIGSGIFFVLATAGLLVLLAFLRRLRRSDALLLLALYALFVVIMLK